MATKTFKAFDEDSLDDLLKVTEEDLTPPPVLEEEDFDEFEEDEEEDEEALLAKLAALRAKKNKNSAVPKVIDDDKEFITIHFLADGFTAIGETWYRGQEIVFEVGSEAHQATFDREGNSWLDLRHDPQAQMRRYQDHKFADGPWPFLPWGVVLDQNDKQAVEDAKVAAEAENRRKKLAVAPSIR